MKASLRTAPPGPFVAAPAATRASRPSASGPSYLVHLSDHEPIAVGNGPPAFVMRVPTEAYWRKLWQSDAYRAALAFLRGDVEVEGDLVAAIGVWSHAARPRPLASAILSLITRMRPERWFQSRATARRNIEFHYDRSNEFYRTFLDRRMVYSCAYFEHPDQPLEEAQEAKLDLISRKLDLRAGDEFLDVGCGWGALVCWAAERYGARALGCTLSHRQHEAAASLLRERGLAGRARVDLCDYRDVRGRFAKIASVGMVEHVGRARLPGYFKTLAGLLDDSGLFLNHGIVRPSCVREDPAGHFLQERVFPGGELVSLGEMMAAAEGAGFEVLDVENLRPHYALTCRAWVARLQANREACLAVVDAETYRTWLLYLAASATGFEQGTTEVHQLLLAKRTAWTKGRAGQSRRLTRRYIAG